MTYLVLVTRELNDQRSCTQFIANWKSARLTRFLNALSSLGISLGFAVSSCPRRSPFFLGRSD